MRNVNTLVIGGGPTGLAVAYRLQRDTLILEKEAAIGGLCRSIHYEDGVFDIGGHSFHTPYPEVRSVVQTLLDGRLALQKREARVYTHGTLIQYPFQQFFDMIPDPEVTRACREGLRSAVGNAAQAENLADYLTRKFGSGIAECFLLPYNRKLWARDLAQISCEWMPERVATLPGESKYLNTTAIQRRPLQADTQVGYPKQGGFEEIYKSFAPHLPQLELNSSVVHIDPYAHIATTADDRQIHWKFLVSTIPLPKLVQIVEGTPSDIQALADQLDYLSLRVELLLVKQQLDTHIQRIYVADPDIPPHKIALNHNSSARLRQRSQHALMAEVTLSPEKPVVVEEIAPRTIAFLCQLDILESPADVVWQSHVDVEYAYPIYTHSRSTLVRGIKDWMAQHNIYTAGRFGDWEYMNSDKCVWRGLSLACELEALCHS